MPLIPEQKIAEIRDRTDIVQVVGEYVALRRSGVNFKGLCPFHAEKSPSFNVNSAKQIFHCFGCGKSGDVIRFIMEHDAKPFLDVVKELARRAGIDLPEPEVSPAAREAQRRAETDRARLLKLNQLACDFFRAQYAAPSGERARAYVEGKRAIGQAVRDAFLIGYAPPGWDALTRHLETKRVPHELCEAAGLVRARDHAKLAPGAPPTKATHFDLFRDRVMFPLVSAQGEVIAFSGRTLEDPATLAADAPRAPKYINSPESILYRKGDQLYGLHAARQAIRKATRAILVEGNFDVLTMHERGFPETVAPMGTAFTAAQARLLHRSAPGRVYMLLDGDSAGSTAAARNVGIFLEEDLLSFVAALPQGEDPDTFVARYGREACELLFTKAIESVEYFCRYAWDRSGDSLIERARLLEEEAAPLIRKVQNETARRRFAQRLALSLDLPLDSVERVLRGGATHPRSDEAGVSPAASPDADAPPPLDAIDREVLALIAHHPRLMQRPAAVLRCLGSESVQAAISALGQGAQSAKLDLAALSERLHPSLRPQVATAALSGRYAEVADAERALEGFSRRREAERELGELKKKLAEIRTASDPSVKQQLNARIIELKQAQFGLKGQP